MDNPAYTTDFFNVLKNQTRLRIFQMIVNGKCTLAKIQQELKNVNLSYSQYSISDDYIQPLITMGIVTESVGKYNATLFGICINNLLGGFDEFIQKLPSQSECYEETLLCLLLLGPKSRQEIQEVISPIIASRVLKRLATTNLINLPADRNYIFFYKSKRDPALEKLTETEIKVYQAIPEQGIDVDKLAKLVGLSQRRTYNHIRHLKGKKLVFTRNIPITYSLTTDGQKIAIILQNLLQKIDETWSFTECIVPSAQSMYSTVSPLI